jgi:hypothetical protein
VELVPVPEFDGSQTQRQAVAGGHKAGVHQNAAAGVKPWAPSLGKACRNLLQNSDRLRVFMAIRELRRIVKNQDRRVCARSESFARGREVAGKNIGFANSIIAKETIGSLGIRPVLTCPWGRGADSARQLLQQLSKSLAVAHILELASHNFIVYPFNRPEIRRRFPASLALNRSAIPHANT